MPIDNGRKDLVRAIGWSLGATAATLLARSFMEPFLLSVERQEAEIPNLPESWEGRRLGLMSDIHNGLPGGNRLVAAEAVRRLLELRPSAVLVAGDFVHGDHEAVRGVVDLLRPLTEEEIPVYAVLGNHDYAMPTKASEGDFELARELSRRLGEIGVRVLENEVVQLHGTEGEEPLHLVGIGAHTPRRDDAREVLARLGPDDPRIVMMHHPASFDRCPAGSAPFAVAGHTHGGQVRLPFAPLVSYLTYMKELKVVVSGWVHDGMIGGYGRAGNRLYVSRGIGCSVVPMRLFCLPELTVFTLRRSA